MRNFIVVSNSHIFVTVDLSEQNIYSIVSSILCMPAKANRAYAFTEATRSSLDNKKERLQSSCPKRAFMRSRATLQWLVGMSFKCFSHRPM